MRNVLKHLFGYFCIIETVAGFGMFLFIKEFRQQFIPTILTVAIFAFLAYLCLKKPRTENEAHGNANNSLNQSTNKYGINNQQDKEQSFTHVAPTINRRVQNDNVPPYAFNLQTDNNSNHTPLSEEYIETRNGIFRADGQPISDDELHYLIRIGYENALQQEQESLNPKFHRTQREEDLSVNFMMKHGNEAAVYTEKFEELYRKAFKTDNLDTKISLLKDAVRAFEKAKKFCYSKGKGGTIYFQDMWECLHNSNNPCFSYLDNINNALEEAIYYRDIAMPEIIRVIAENDGILQKNVYRLLPDMNKSYVQQKIRELTADNKISRTKNGNTYELHVLSENH